jgi:hypothetical protein
MRNLQQWVSVRRLRINAQPIAMGICKAAADKCANYDNRCLRGSSAEGTDGHINVGAPFMAPANGLQLRETAACRINGALNIFLAVRQ